MAESGYGTTALTTGIPDAERVALIRKAFRLEYVTLAWMVVEAGVAIRAGVVARSITLLAFGIDSLIELASAVLLIWRLTVELKRGQSFAESAERAASRIGGILLFALSASWWRPGGAFGREKGKPSRGQAWLSALRPCRSCGFCRGASYGSLPRLAVMRYVPTPWRA